MPQHASPQSIAAAKARQQVTTAQAQVRQAALAAAMRNRPAGSRVGK
jgi:hypothetical protein